jgi:hypothetical protein
MSTYYTHIGGTYIQEVVDVTKWKIGNKDETISIDQSIDQRSFYITNGRDYVWVDVDTTGMIQGFTRYGANDPSFMIDLIGECISEYELSYGMIERDDELDDWLKENTFSDNC